MQIEVRPLGLIFMAVFPDCRNSTSAAQAQSRIKILEKVTFYISGTSPRPDCVKQLPELEPPEAEESETFRFVNISHD